jgi:hypothetical protein
MLRWEYPWDCPRIMQTGILRGSRETLVKENVSEKGKEHWRRRPF